VIRRLLFLLGGCAAFCLLVGLPARHLGGDQAFAFIATALALCLAPAVVTLLWGERALRQSVDQQLVMVLGGTGVRMAFVLLAGWALYQYVPYYQRQSRFLIWLAVCYLFTLALDIILLLTGREDRESWIVNRESKNNDSSPSAIHEPRSTTL
jgi:threonine/homoserine/homoserine lactone efflux protein